MAVEDSTEFFRRYSRFCGSARYGFVLRSDDFFISLFYRDFPKNEIASLFNQAVTG